jgi:hypothetical protein
VVVVGAAAFLQYIYYFPGQSIDNNLERIHHGAIVPVTHMQRSPLVVALAVVATDASTKYVHDGNSTTRHGIKQDRSTQDFNVS